MHNSGSGWPHIFGQAVAQSEYTWLLGQAVAVVVVGVVVGTVVGVVVEACGVVTSTVDNTVVPVDDVGAVVL